MNDSKFANNEQSTLTKSFQLKQLVKFGHVVFELCQQTNRELCILIRQVTPL